MRQSRVHWLISLLLHGLVLLGLLITHAPAPRRLYEATISVLLNQPLPAIDWLQVQSNDVPAPDIVPEQEGFSVLVHPEFGGDEKGKAGSGEAAVKISDQKVVFALDLSGSDPHQRHPPIVSLWSLAVLAEPFFHSLRAAARTERRSQTQVPSSVDRSCLSSQFGNFNLSREGIEPVEPTG